VYGVLFVTLLPFGAKTSVNCTAKWLCGCTSDCEYFFDLTGTEGKDRSKTSIYRKFGCHLCLLQHDNTLKKTLHSNVFFDKWNDTEKRNLRKESWQTTSGTTKWDKLGQVGVVGQVGQGEGGLQILVGKVEQGEGGLQIFVGQVGQGQVVCPLEPFHLSQMGLQGREKFHDTSVSLNPAQLPSQSINDSVHCVTNGAEYCMASILPLGFSNHYPAHLRRV